MYLLVMVLLPVVVETGLTLIISIISVVPGGCDSLVLDVTPRRRQVPTEDRKGTRRQQLCGVVRCAFLPRGLVLRLVTDSAALLALGLLGLLLWLSGHCSLTRRQLFMSA